MNGNVSVRRLLKRFDISEFDESVAEKIDGQSEAYAVRAQTSFFERFFMSAAMWLTALSAFAALSAYIQTCGGFSPAVNAAVAGGILLLFFLSVCFLFENAVPRRFLWAYALAGGLLFLSGVFHFSPVAATAFAGASFFLVGQNERHTFQQTTTVIVFLYFLTKTVLFYETAHALFFLTLLTFPFGFAGTVFPVRQICPQRAAALLTFFAPTALLCAQGTFLTDLTSVPPTRSGALIFVIAAAVLMKILWCEMDSSERKKAKRFFAAYAVGAAVLPACATGAVLTALLAYFVNSVLAFRASVFLFAASLFLFVLSLPLSFLQAAGVFALTGGLIFLFGRRAPLFKAKENA